MVAQPITAPVAEFGAVTSIESAVSLWAVFNTLDAMPATPETQLAFEEARRRLQLKLAAAGLDTDRLTQAFGAIQLPALEPRGDPPLGC